MSDDLTYVSTPNAAGKVAKPDLYYGDRTKLEDWLMQVDLYFKFIADSVPDDDKVCFVSTFMRGEAQAWIKPCIVKYLDEDNEDEDVAQLIEHYANFKTQIRQVFGVTNEASTSARTIQELKQHRSAAEYTTEFQKHAIILGWEDEPLKTMYKQGLKWTVKKELMRSGASTNTLEELYRETIRIDSDLHDLAAEMGHHRGTRNSYGKPPPRPKNNGNRPRYIPARFRANSNVTDPYGLQPMQLDVVQKGGKQKGSNKPYSGGGETRTCYNCGKTGHISRNCRSKNKVSRQLNMLTVPTTSYEDDEWEVIEARDEEPDENPREENRRRLSKARERHIRNARRQMLTPAQPVEEVFQYLDKDQGEEKFTTWQERDAELKGEEWEYAESPEEFHTCHSDKENIDPEEERTALQDRKSRQQPNWVDEELSNYVKTNGERIRRQDIGTMRTASLYHQDWRNKKHVLYSWAFCNQDDCRVHYDDKLGAGWFPTRKANCKFYWFECMKTCCEEHLWEKRARPFFPNKEPAEMMNMQLLINGKCTQTQWQTCIHPSCQTHEEEKEYHGFGDEQSFLDRDSAQTRRARTD
jgi:hypothetical protein